MERLPCEVFSALGLEVRDVAALGCTKKALRTVSDDLLCARGIVLRERDSYAVLQQPRWFRLQKLHVKGWPLALYKTLPVFQVIPDPVPQSMPFLKELTLAHTRLPTAAHGCWTRVFERAPFLESVSLEDSFGLRNYCAYVRHCRDLLVTGAFSLKRLSFRCCGLVLYPLPTAAWLVAADAIRDNGMEEGGNGDDSAENAHRLSRAACDAVLAVHKRPVVVSDTLEEYINTGQQLAMLPVNAPLIRAELEDPDLRPFLLDRIGPKAEPTLRSLRWSVLAANFNGLSAARFAGLKRLSITLRAAASAEELEDRLRTLADLPPGLEELDLAIEVGKLDPTQRLTWPPTGLAHLATLRKLGVCMTYALPGIQDLAEHRMGVGESLKRVALETVHPPEECLEGALEDLIEGLRDQEYHGLDDENDADSENENDDMYGDHDEVQDLQDAIDTCKATGVGADIVWAALERFPDLHFVLSNVRVWAHPNVHMIEHPRLSIRNTATL